MKTTATETVREFYEQHAASYSTMMDDEIDLPMYETVLADLAERIATVEGTILDSACGSGHMLAQLQNRYTPGRQLLGVDLSPQMVAISQKRLGETALVTEGDMSDLSHLAEASCAAVINFFALHHVDLAGMERCFTEWYRVLKRGGLLLVGTWEGEGYIDYGEHADISALKYSQDDLEKVADAAGFKLDKIWVEPVEEMSMSAIYLFATKHLDVN